MNVIIDSNVKYIGPLNLHFYPIKFGNGSSLCTDEIDTSISTETELKASKLEDTEDKLTSNNFIFN
ncbi:MAG: hypothetical protein ACI9QD_000907 [Thermoproteota archaeon]|jgi:hypothetical protein